jgi:hypothetical protein
VKGSHNIYLVAAGTSSVNLLSLNWFQFQSDTSVYGDMTNNGGNLSSSLAVTGGTLQNLVDDDILTGFTGSADVSEVYVQYQSSAPVMLRGYSLCAGLEANDPVAWTLKASNDGEEWTTLHEQEDVAFAARAQQIRFNVEPSIPYIYYRLCFTLPEGADKLSLSEWQLLGRGISLTDITADGGSITSGLEALIDHQGETATLTPFTAAYKSEGNYAITSYAVTCTAGKAPTAWTLEGSVNGTTWKVIDQRTDIQFPYPASTYICNLSAVPAYQYYRLKVLEEGAEVAQWQLYGSYDFGAFYADVTSFAQVFTGAGDDASALVDNVGETSSTVQGDFMQWNFVMPVPVKVVGFSMTCADDASFDPSNFTLYGISENGSKTQIVNRAVTFNTRAAKVTATISSSVQYKNFQLVVNQTTSGGNTARLADFELFGTAIAETGEDALLLPASVEASVVGATSTEGVEKLSDQSRTTRYRTNFTAPVSVTYTYDSPIAIHYYTITAAKDGAANDPKDWKFEASNDGTNWVAIDERQGELFSNRYATQVYKVSDELEPAAYSHYRLTVNAVNGGTQMHISELQLLNLYSWYMDGGKTTAISDVAEKILTPDTCVYNLAGQIVGTSLSQMFDRLPKGIYVVGGKKIQKK